MRYLKQFTKIKGNREAKVAAAFCKPAYAIKKSEYAYGYERSQTSLHQRFITLPRSLRRAP